MKTITAFVLVALFGALSASNAVYKELNQINKNKFGATILAAISTNLRAKTPVADVENLLEQILADLRADSATLDSTYNDKHDSLSNAISGSQNLIDTTQQTIDGLTAAIEQYDADGQAATQDYVDAQNDLEATQDALDSLNSDHDTQTQNYADDIANLNAAIQACNDALKKLSTYSSATATSLIQVASAAKLHLSNFAAKMKEMSHKISKHGSMYSPLIHELVELTQNVEDDQVNQVVDLLNQLLNLLNQALADLNTQAADYENTYQTKVAQANANIDHDNQRLVDDQSRIDSDNVQEGNALAQLENARQNLVDAQNTLEQQQASYDQNEDNYADQRPRYDDLIAILETLIKHFHDNIDTLDEWTQAQVNGN